MYPPNGHTSQEAKSSTSLSGDHASAYSLPLIQCEPSLWLRERNNASACLRQQLLKSTVGLVCLQSRPSDWKPADITKPACKRCHKETLHQAPQSQMLTLCLNCKQVSEQVNRNLRSLSAPAQWRLTSEHLMSSVRPEVFIYASNLFFHNTCVKTF